jgi:hypothetical protein
VKKISILLSITVFCFFVYDIYQIQAIGYKLNSPLVPVGVVEDIKHPYIILAILHVIAFAALSTLYVKSLFKINVTVATVIVLTTIIINYFCLLCVA